MAYSGGSGGRAGGGRGDGGASKPPRKGLDMPFCTVGKDNAVSWEPGLPAQVVCRRHHDKGPDFTSDSRVRYDLKAVLKFRPQEKVDWLTAVLKGFPEGKAKIYEIFDIVSHPKFAAGLPNRTGCTLYSMLTESMNIFSDKQQATLRKCRLAEEFGAPVAHSDDDESSSSPRVAKKEAPRKEHRDDKRRDEPLRSDEVSRVRESRDRARSPDRSRERLDHRTRKDDALRKDAEAREDERRKFEAEKRALMEREQVRKAKIGGAFLMGDEEDDDDFDPAEVKVPGRGSGPQVVQDLPRASEAVRWPAIDPSDSSSYKGVAGGGDRVLADAHAILKKAAGAELKLDRDSRSRSRSRRRRSPRRRTREEYRKPRPRPESTASFRSPTPDGRARGQARAARKAKMMQQLMGGGRL